ncbi:MAG: hypothetical protein II909_03130 [Kiritimatiellae bacterium]|nr:hypothetical protein [Kiritimatiellia bacterium]
MSPLAKFLTGFHMNHTCDEIPMDLKAFVTRIIIRLQRDFYHTGSARTAYALAPKGLDFDDSIEFIYRKILEGKPFFAGKIGTIDGEVLLRYMDIHDKESLIIKWMKLLAGRRGPFWWDNSIRAGICRCAGVFPTDIQSIERFCREFSTYCTEFDGYARWVYGERRLFNSFCPNATPIDLKSLVPIDHPNTWYGALKGKKVLVVHQYVRTIKSQYEKHVEFHKGQGALPELELIQYKPVNSAGGKNKEFPNWSAALNHMMADISNIDFDVALLGCGVYGVPLSAYIKRMGKIAIYTGGGTQAIFGIKGKRWDNLGIYNEHWVRPFPEDIPETLPIIEDGAFV